MSVVTLAAQQALTSSPIGVTQPTSSSSPVNSNGYCNVLVQTQPFNNAPGAAVSFAYLNPLISPDTNVSAVIFSSPGGTGNPGITLSGQTNGVIYATITNLHPTQALSGGMNISFLVY